MFVIGISGGTGSGKTTIVNQIKAELSSTKICTISQDSYYKNTDHLTEEKRRAINFDHPNSIDFDLLAQHINQLKSGKTIKQPIYCFKAHNRTKESILIASKDIIIIEGILIFSNKTILDLFDLTVFIDVDADERLIRRIKRDTKERGRTIDEVISRYLSTIKPMHDTFIEPTKKDVDIILPNNNNAILNIVKTLINRPC